MPRTRSSAADKTLSCAFLCTICAILMASCQRAQTQAHDPLKNGTTKKHAADNPRDHDPVASQSQPTTDGGATFALVAQSQKSKSGGKGKSKDSKKEESKKQPAPKEAPPSPDEFYTLVLGTFSDANHEIAAANMVENLRTIAPQINGARVHSTATGSLVIFGRYRDREDAAAKSDQEKLKRITHRNQPVFKRVILTKIEKPLSQQKLNPFDLRSARLKHPNVDPLYTLDIAVWVAIDDPSAERNERITFEESRKKAEAHAAELRAKGFEAYFFHDTNKQLSSVTVGLFDRRAIHEISRLYSAEVTALQKKFPVRHLNGQPVDEPAYKPIDQRHGKVVTIPQTPSLVLVPNE